MFRAVRSSIQVVRVALVKSLDPLIAIIKKETDMLVDN